MRFLGSSIVTLSLGLTLACQPMGKQSTKTKAQISKTTPTVGATQQSACLQQAPEVADTVRLTAIGNTLQVVDPKAFFNCCMEATMETTIANNNITIVEKEVGDPAQSCNCNCDYELTQEISNLSDGDYSVSIYRYDTSQHNLVTRQTVSLPGSGYGIGSTQQSECLSHDSDVSCDSMDAVLDNSQCDTFWGYTWDGTQCHYLGGACNCDGEDCGNLYQTEQACQDAYGECTSNGSSQVEVLVNGHTLTIVDGAAEFNCCLHAWMEVQTQGSLITVVEMEDPDATEACDCLCEYELSVDVTVPADGTYTVKVYSGLVAEDNLIDETIVVVE